MKLIDKINELKARQLSIDTLLEEGIFTVENGKLKTKTNNYTLELLYQNPDITIGFGYADAGEHMPAHAHEVSKHYLICVKGSFSIKFGNNFRVIKIGDCVALPENVIHEAVGLENSSKLLFICVPYDKDFGRLLT